MITGDQIAAHLVGDYLLQSQWMADQKTRRLLVAAIHALTYSAAFYFLRPSLPAWLVMVVTHALIDRYRLARYVVWLKNCLSPFNVLGALRLISPWRCRHPAWLRNFEPDVYAFICACGARKDCGVWSEEWSDHPGRLSSNPPWAECSATGYQKDLPPWLATWLLIIADNILHLIINGICLTYL
jgi:hypothetical protein